MHNDDELIEGCRQHKQSHQEALYKKYFAYGMSVALRYARTRDDALHILNDSFMKVFTRIQDFRKGQPFRPWLRKILIRTALDAWRSTRTYHDVIESAAEPPVDIDISDTDDLQHLGADEILDMLSALSEPQRVIFNLYEIEGYSHDEIASMLGIAPGTSRSHLSRARTNLAGLYQQKLNSATRASVS